MDRMSFIAKLRVKLEKAKDFEALQIKLRELTFANEPGTPIYELLRDRDDPLTYMCVATFTDNDAFEFHQKTPFHDELVPPILECLASDMELSFYDSLEKIGD